MLGFLIHEAGVRPGRIQNVQECRNTKKFENPNLVVILISFLLERLFHKN